MCGIAGIVFDDAERAIGISELKPMTDSIRHRGPDGEGFFTDRGAGLGFRRLSIIDLATGDQPILNEDGKIALVCNGEIYNYKELRSGLVSRGHRFKTFSDAEVILHLYEEHGAGCVDFLRGMFAFAVWDSNSRTLLLGRDRFGIKPLFYASVQGALYFGSEQKAILASNQIERRMNVRAMEDLFTFGFAMDPHTFFTGIRSLPPGHTLVWKGGSTKIKRYWDIDYHPSVMRGAGKASAGEWAERLEAKLDETVRVHMQSDVELGAWLSPGIDSSAVAAIMARHAGGPFKAFSLGFEERVVDELSTAKTLDCYPGFDIERLDVECKNKHFSLLPLALWHKEYAVGGAIDIVRMILAEHTARHVKVILTGEGADELFGGYPWYMANKVLKPFARLPLFLRRLVTLAPFVRRKWPGGCRILTAPYKMGLERYALLIERGSWQATLGELFSDDVNRALALDAGDSFEPPEGFDEWHPFNQLLYLDTRLRMNSSIVLHLDRQTMAHSVEARVPFLDHELFELVSAMPPSLKMRRIEEKYILRRAMAKVLPDEIASRKKRSLSAPLGAWMRKNPLPGFANELLGERKILEKGYFKPVAVKELMDANRRGESTAYVRLFMVLSVQLWDEMFIKGVSPKDISGEI